jgi:hypothetical protein
VVVQPRFANATLYWICVAVMAVALVELAWPHWFRFADNMLSDWQLKGRASTLAAGLGRARFMAGS